jgi:hypothetical protein
MSKEKLKPLVSDDKNTSVNDALLRKDIRDFYKGNNKEHDLDEYDMFIIEFTFKYVKLKQIS